MSCMPHFIDAPAPAHRLARSWRLDTNVEGRTSIRLGEPPAPQEPPRPRRGAFPTRRSDLDQAKPFVPDLDESKRDPSAEPEKPPDREPRPKRSNDSDP